MYFKIRLGRVNANSLSYSIELTIAQYKEIEPYLQGSAHDAPEGKKLMEKIPEDGSATYLIMDCAYEGDETRQLPLYRGFELVVPPKANQLQPWESNKEIYKRRNEVKQLFVRLEGFRRIFSRFDKLDQMLYAFIAFALIFDSICVNTS